MTLRRKLRRSNLLATALALTTLGLTISAASPARADRCEDIANQLKSNVDGLKVNFTAGGIVYLTHPQAKELTLGCRGADYSNELYAKADSRNPKPAFFDLVGRAAAVVFTVPKDDTMTGVTRCIKRMGLLRGDNVTMRFRRLNMNCTRTKTEAAIAITRGKDE
jgi:hypothetical protein